MKIQNNSKIENLFEKNLTHKECEMRVYSLKYCLAYLEVCTTNFKK